MKRDIHIATALMVRGTYMLGGLVTVVYITSFIDNEVTGLYFYVKSLSLVVFSIVNNGWITSIARTVSQQYKFSSTYLLQTVFLIVTSSLVLYWILQLQDIKVATLFLASSLLNTANLIGAGIMKGLGRTIICDVPIGIIKQVVLLMLLISRGVSDIYGLIILEIYALSISLLISFIILFGEARRQNERGNISCTPDNINNQKYLLLNGLLVTTLRNIDLILIGYFLGSNNVTEIKLLKTVYENSINIGNALVQKETNRIFKLGATRDTRAIKAIIDNIFMVSFFTRAIAALFILMLAISNIPYFDQFLFEPYVWISLMLALAFVSRFGPYNTALIGLRLDAEVFLGRIIIIFIQLFSLIICCLWFSDLLEIVVVAIPVLIAAVFYGIWRRQYV